MSQLAIRGHATRGKEVIEILEMLGGINSHNLYGDGNYAYYTIDSDNEIKGSIYVFDDEQLCHFTLEQFEEKFPYKIGDKVQYKGATSCGSVYKIEKLRWEDNRVEYIVSILGNGSRLVFTAEVLRPFEEETMEEKKINQISLANCELDEVEIILGDNFEIVLKQGKFYAVRKKPKYPKTYEECCIIIGFNSNALKLNNPFSINKDTHSYIKHLDNLIDSFYKLLICRDAYWKIVGDWEEKRKVEEMHYIIYSTLFGEVLREDIPRYIANSWLDFPTEEMRDVFYENFKDLIEKCKELL